MRITTVHFERKRSDQAYGNRSLSLTAELEEGENPTAAIESLALLVHTALDRDEQQEQEERIQREEDRILARGELEEPDDDDPDEEDDEIPW